MELSLWEKLSTALQSSELDEVLRTVGSKLVDSNKSTWLEFEAMLDIFCENSNAGDPRSSIMMAVQLALRNPSVDVLIQDFTKTQNICIKPNFRTLCVEVESVLEKEITVLRDKIGEIEVDLYTQIDTPKGTPTTSNSNTPSKKLESNTITTSLSVGVVPAPTKCMSCGGKKKGCPQCLLLRDTTASSGVVGSLKQQVAVGRMMRKEEKILRTQTEKMSTDGSMGFTASLSQSSNSFSSCAGSTVDSQSRGLSPTRETKSAPPCSKLRSKLQSARDEKHFLDDSDII